MGRESSLQLMVKYLKESLIKTKLLDKVRIPIAKVTSIKDLLLMEFHMGKENKHSKT